VTPSYMSTDKTLSKIVVRLLHDVSNGTFCLFDDPLKERSSTFHKDKVYSYK